MCSCFPPQSVSINPSNGREVCEPTFHHLFEFVCARQRFRLKLRGPLPLRCLDTILRAIAVAKAETKGLVGTVKGKSRV